MMSAQAQGTGEVSPFANHLAKPPAFNPDAVEEKAQPDCTVPDNQRAHPLECTVAQTPATRSASVKRESIAAMDIMLLPPPAAGDRKVSQAIAASKKDEMIKSEWKMGFELRNSPVTEAHGNAERHDSIGGLIKGNMKF